MFWSVIESAVIPGRAPLGIRGVLMSWVGRGGQARRPLLPDEFLVALRAETPARPDARTALGAGHAVRGGRQGRRRDRGHRGGSPSNGGRQSGRRPFGRRWRRWPFAGGDGRSAVLRARKPPPQSPIPDKEERREKGRHGEEEQQERRGAEHGSPIVAVPDRDGDILREDRLARQIDRPRREAVLSLD